MVPEIDCFSLNLSLEREEVYLVDVREQDEYICEKIEGATLHPLSLFNPKEIKTSLPVVFMCRSGSRSQRATHLYLATFPGNQAFNLKGGTLAWKGAGYPTQKTL